MSNYPPIKCKFYKSEVVSHRQIGLSKNLSFVYGYRIRKKNRLHHCATSFCSQISKLGN